MAKLYRDYVIEALEAPSGSRPPRGFAAALRPMVEEVVLTPEGDTLGIVLRGTWRRCWQLQVRSLTVHVVEPSDTWMKVEVNLGPWFGRVVHMRLVFDGLKQVDGESQHS